MNVVIWSILTMVVIVVGLRTQRKPKTPSLPSPSPLNNRETTQQLEAYLNHESWEYRYHAFQRLLNDTHPSSHLLLKGLGDAHHDVRREAFEAIEARRRRRPHHGQHDALLHGQNPQFVDAVAGMLDDPQVHFRKKAIHLLRTSHRQASIGPLLKALGDADASVRKAANRALKHQHIVIQTVTFAPRPFEIQHAGKTLVLLNPDVSQMPIPIAHLRAVHILAEHCDRERVSRFAAYLVRQCPPRWLKKHLHITIYGNPLQLPRAVWPICTACKDVETEIDMIYFGASVPLRLSQRTGTLPNPDMTLLQFPLWQLQMLVIDLDTHNFQALEHFVTYALSYLGARHCQQHLSAYLLGKNPQAMHVNLRNNLTSLCKSVEVCATWERIRMMRVNTCGRTNKEV